MVWLLSFQILLWTSLMFFPFMFVLSPVYLLLMFKFEYLFLRKIRRKPLDTVNNDVTPVRWELLGNRGVHHGVPGAFPGGHASRPRLVSV